MRKRRNNIFFPYSTGPKTVHRRYFFSTYSHNVPTQDNVEIKLIEVTFLLFYWSEAGVKSSVDYKSEVTKLEECSLQSTLTKNPSSTFFILCLLSNIFLIKENDISYKSLRSDHQNIHVFTKRLQLATIPPNCKIKLSKIFPVASMTEMVEAWSSLHTLYKNMYTLRLHTITNEWPQTHLCKLSTKLFVTAP